MLDLKNLPTEATMRLTRCAARREGAGISWDVELSMEVPGEDEAILVEQYVPGALAAYHARETSKGVTKTSGGFDLARVLFRNAQGDRLARSTCEVRNAEVKTTAAQAVLALRLRLHGLMRDAAMELVYSLDEQVQVQLSPNVQQLSLFGPSGPPPADIVGRVVVHKVDDDRLVAGTVSYQDGRTLEIATMEDEELVKITLQGQHPDSVLQVRAPEGQDLQEMVRAYIERCDKAHIKASWNDVVTALGQLYADGELTAEADFAWVLKPMVWDAAFQLAGTTGVAPAGDDGDGDE